METNNNGPFTVKEGSSCFQGNADELELDGLSDADAPIDPVWIAQAHDDDDFWLAPSTLASAHTKHHHGRNADLDAKNQDDGEAALSSQVESSRGTASSSSAATSATTAHRKAYTTGTAARMEPSSIPILVAKDSTRSTVRSETAQSFAPSMQTAAAFPDWNSQLQNQPQQHQLLVQPQQSSLFHGTPRPVRMVQSTHSHDVTRHDNVPVFSNTASSPVVLSPNSRPLDRQCREAPSSSTKVTLADCRFAASATTSRAWMGGRRFEPVEAINHDDSSGGGSHAGSSNRLSSIVSVPPPTMTTASSHADDGEYFTATGLSIDRRPTPLKRQRRRPVRALNAYNFFFRFERDRLLKYSTEKGAISDESNLPAEYFEYRSWTVENSIEAQREILNAQWSRDPTVKRKHCKVHGRISFQALTMRIAATWKSLPQTVRDVFAAIAQQDAQRFDRERIPSFLQPGRARPGKEGQT